MATKADDIRAGDEWRKTSASYPRRRAVPIRFSDIDMFRHLNNVAAGQFYEEARYELLDAAQRLVPREERTALVVANVNTSFLAQARYPGTIDVMTGIAEIGERSFVIAQGLFLGDVCISVADTVIVAVAGEGRGGLPDLIRAHLRSLTVDTSRPE